MLLVLISSIMIRIIRSASPATEAKFQMPLDNALALKGGMKQAVDVFNAIILDTSTSQQNSAYTVPRIKYTV